ncbi:MAG TPA: hypothetical protein V6C88_01865 [Chroococcidiopsis sp.]
MNTPPTNSGSVNISVTGSIQGNQVALGSAIHQQHTQATPPSPMDIEVGEFVELLRQIRAQATTAAQPEHRQVTLQWVDELEQAVTAEKPNPTRLARIKQWFLTYLPAVSGAVTSVVVHPIVGKLVEATGDALATDIRRRLEERLD